MIAVPSLSYEIEEFLCEAGTATQAEADLFLEYEPKSPDQIVVWRLARAAAKPRKAARADTDNVDTGD